MPQMGHGDKVLSDAAALVAGAKVDFDTLSKNLEDQISALKGKWAGAGSLAFHSLHAAWTEKQKIVVSALNDFESSLIETDRDDTQTDESSAGYMAKLTSRVG